jgi:two-component sensor histidine kinase
VKDNGIGLPEGFALDTHGSIGSGIVRLIAEHQLQGAVEFERGDTGTTVHVRFKEPQYEQRI